MAHTEEYELAQHEPKGKPDDLKVWWRPDLRPGYLMYKVQVLGRREEDGLVYLNFKLAGKKAANLPKNDFEVELTSEIERVWPHAPSTAQLAAEGQFGFLLLSEEWRTNESIPTGMAEDGDKWPITAGEEEPQLLQLVAEITSDTDGMAKLTRTLKSLVKQRREKRHER